MTTMCVSVPRPQPCCSRPVMSLDTGHPAPRHEQDRSHSPDHFPVSAGYALQRRQRMENNIGAAVFGAVATLAGVLITHLFAQRRFERQLAFDKEQKSIERMTELRTEVYLDAAARSGQMGGYIVRVQALVSSNQFQNHDEYDAFMESLNKLCVVAEPETAFQAGETLSAFSSAFSTALTASLKLAVLETDITKAAERRATAKENWGVALVEMTVASNADDITRTQAAVAKLRATRDLLRSCTSVHLQLTTERRELLRQYHAMVSDKLRLC